MYIYIYKDRYIYIFIYCEFKGSFRLRLHVVSLFGKRPQLNGDRVANRTRQDSDRDWVGGSEKRVELRR